MTHRLIMPRRRFLAGSAAATGLLASPAIVRAQARDIRIGKTSA
ncbi:MAG: hypothetical protein ACNA7Q_09090 [Rhodobacterales bacterium]